MAAVMIKDRGLRKKLTQEGIPEKTPKKPCKRKATPGSSKDKKNEQNNNKRPKIQTGDPKLDLFTTYQPWVIQTYGDLAKTKTITLKKYARILRTLRGEECNSSDSSKFRFWVKAKGFHVGKPPGYDAKPADGIVCRYSVVDAEGCSRGLDGQELYSGSQNDPPLYIPTPPVKIGEKRQHLDLSPKMLHQDSTTAKYTNFSYFVVLTARYYWLFNSMLP
ncbi:unnamed protein product [Leptidea sinapis]|uniref:Nucleolar protein 4 n=1 Tax=Leptidea sinapis TaxID=189913 RepID=A0A5E4PN54_9NEOP|nr:unnamed protein product [Leptidea sinapis]